MSDNFEVFNKIEAFLSDNWGDTPILYPNVSGKEVGESEELSEGTGDYIRFQVSFGPRKTKEVGRPGSALQQCDGVVVFLARTRMGNGDAVLHQITGNLLQLFEWTEQVLGVVFTDGKSFPPYDTGEWREMPCSVNFYFNRI